jgi:hypothetical protein
MAHFCRIDENGIVQQVVVATEIWQTLAVLRKSISAQRT